jgi:CDP-diacylglycerol--glycerol-3-phosphate 3-phosphatidyltransferase
MQDRFWPFLHEQSWMITLVFIAVVGSFMVSYAKARAEGLGLECKTGLLARPERVVILAIGLLTGAVIWALVILAIFSNVTAIERIVHVWRATRLPVAMTEVSNFSSDGHMNETNNSSIHRQVPIVANEGKEPSVPSVHTAVPPFTGGVQQD